MTDIRAINEVAARWHARGIIGRLAPEDERRLDAWLAEDVRHRLAYAEMAAASYALEQAVPKVAIQNVAIKTGTAQRWPIWIAATFASTLLFVAVIWTPHAWQDWHSDAYTVAGSLRTMRLADGSILQLDTDTAVKLPFAPDRRDIELLRGELAVEVAKDTAHPFRVHCAGIEARAVGTHFIVARRASDVEVGVTEGVVAISAENGSSAPILIQAGQRVLVDAHSGAIRSEPLPTMSYGWTRGVLSFDRLPLQQVVAEIARYLPEHVVFCASQHAATPVTATFPIDKPDAALLAVAKTNGLTIRHVANLLYVVQD
jgi:transmembrane sensor